MSKSDDTPYHGTGNLGQAIKDFKMAVVTNQIESWPKFWKEFARQAYADLLSVELKLFLLDIENRNLTKKVRKMEMAKKTATKKTAKKPAKKSATKKK